MYGPKIVPRPAGGGVDLLCEYVVEIPRWIVDLFGLDEDTPASEYPAELLALLD